MNEEKMLNYFVSFLIVSIILTSSIAIFIALNLQPDLEDKIVIYNFSVIQNETGLFLRNMGNTTIYKQSVIFYINGSLSNIRNTEDILPNTSYQLTEVEGGNTIKAVIGNYFSELTVKNINKQESQKEILPTSSNESTIVIPPKGNTTSTPTAPPSIPTSTTGSLPPISTCSSPIFLANACIATSNSLNISWSGVSGATVYTVSICDASGQSCVSSLENASANSKLYSNLSSNTTYMFKAKVNSSDNTCTSPSLESATTCNTTALATQFSIPVLVLNYFPIEDGKLDPAITGMNDDLSTIRTKTKNLVSGIAKLLTEASIYHGYKDSSATPSLEFTISEEKEFLEPLPIGKEVPWKPGQGIYRPDYYKILSNISICDYVDNKGVKMVWVMGYHYGNIEPVESNMAMGRASNTFWNYETYGDISNSEQSDDIPTCEKTYVLTNPNYARDVGMEGYGHHLEAVFKFIDYNLFWNKFVGPFGNQLGNRHCGWMHYPPNGASDYDFKNETDMVSDCEDWKPDVSGEKKIVDCHTWYAPFGSQCTGDTEGFAFQRWWTQNIPGKDNNLFYNGKKMRNWWEFIGDFDSALKVGKSFLS